MDKVKTHINTDMTKAKHTKTAEKNESKEREKREEHIKYKTKTKPNLELKENHKIPAYTL